MHIDDNGQQWYTVREFASKAGTTVERVRRYVARIPGAKLDNRGAFRWLIPVAALDAYIENGGIEDGGWMRVSEVCALTGLAPRTVRRMVVSGVWEYTKGGERGNYRISRASFEKWKNGLDPVRADDEFTA